MTRDVLPKNERHFVDVVLDGALCARDRAKILSVPPEKAGRLSITTVPFEDLDLVAVRVLHEEEARHQRAVAVKFFDVVRIQTERLKPRVLRLGVVDAKSDMAIAIAMRIRFFTPLVERQFNFEIDFGVFGEYGRL